MRTMLSSITVYPLVALIALSLISCNRFKQIIHPPRALTKSARLEVYSVTSTKTPGLEEVVDPQTGNALYLVLPPILSSADVATVQLINDSPEMPSLAFQLTPRGGQKLSVTTTPARGQQLAIVVNGEMISAPQVRSPISNSFRISGFVRKREEEILEALTEE